MNLAFVSEKVEHWLTYRQEWCCQLNYNIYPNLAK